MNLDSRKGDKVIAAEFDCNGSEQDRLSVAEAGIKEGDVLTVEHLDVYPWDHRVEFREYPGKRFNGVMFQNIETSKMSQPVVLELVKRGEGK